ncbi:hypothetical protein Dip510_001296 [Elusimicrobium posterum]|uniref:hypothetical protein n=1 Tax=Elusimicrobium posterum TaxID=3116653 RepID=UPI003C776F00
MKRLIALVALIGLSSAFLTANAQSAVKKNAPQGEKYDLLANGKEKTMDYRNIYVYEVSDGAFKVVERGGLIRFDGIKFKNNKEYKGSISFNFSFLKGDKPNQYLLFVESEINGLKYDIPEMKVRFDETFNPRTKITDVTFTVTFPKVEKFGNEYVYKLLTKKDK